MEGMLAVPAPGSEYEGWCRILRASDDGAVNSWTDEDGHILDAEEDGDFATFADLIPWLGELVTLGGLLALAREKWGTVYAKPEEDRWTVRGPTGHIVGQGPTEAAALVAALEVSRG